jgi:3-oxoacyl-[acyl-carrier protein] reductase
MEPKLPSQKPNKVALITGASREPALTLGPALAQEGWCVALNDLNPHALDTVVQLILENGGKARAHIADVSQKLALQTILNDIEDEWGQIDLLINNTRVMPNNSFLEMDEWDWRRAMDVNLTGAFLLTQVVGRMMRARGRGNIIHLTHANREKGYAAYTATQAGLEGFIHVAKQELEGFGLQVKVINVDKFSDKILLDKIL